MTQRSRVQKNGDEISPHGPRYKKRYKFPGFLRVPTPTAGRDCDAVQLLRNGSPVWLRPWSHGSGRVGLISRQLGFRFLEKFQGSLLAPRLRFSVVLYNQVKNPDCATGGF